MISAAAGNLTIKQFRQWSKTKDILHFVTTRSGGVSKGSFSSLNFGSSQGDDIENVETNFSILAGSLNLPREMIILTTQVHGNNIVSIPSVEAAHRLVSTPCLADGLITAVPGICIAVKCADCTAVLFYDPARRIIAVAHAGWRGTTLKIAAHTIRRMVQEFGCSPADIMAGIGPSIGPENFEVGKEVTQQFTATFPDQYKKIIRIAGNKQYINLWEANRLQLITEGVLPHNIECAGICTVSHHSEFFSHRASGGITGRFMAGIMLKE